MVLRIPDVVSVKLLKQHILKPVIEQSDAVHYNTLMANRQKATKIAKTRAAIKSHRAGVKARNYTIHEDLNNYAYDDYVIDTEFDIINFTTDAQNVHNSLVQDTIKTKYSANSTNDESNANTNSEKQIKCFDEILTVAGDKADAVRHVLYQIQTRNAAIANLHSSEVCVLNDSWAVASAGVKIQIVNELLDARDGDYLVCPTGVVSRIINADVVEHPESSPRTEAQLRAEMLSSAAAVRATLEADAAYRSADATQQSTLLKAALLQKYTNDYDGIITQQKIQNELDTWLAHI